MTSEIEKVAKRADDEFERAVDRLSAFLRIPAISCDKSHHADVRKLAGEVKASFEALGFANARLLDLPDALPCVAAEWMNAGPDAPTLLIYGHLDLQPVKGEVWDTPPHEPTRKQTPRGERLYARGAADDMGGWVSWLAAFEAYFHVSKRLPCNVRILIEGEEEIGSPNLERFMDAFPEAFAADAMVLTDCENPSVDIPGLTVSLRGLLDVSVVCESATSDVHSGLWGNVVPDPAMSLVKILSRLVDDDGRMKLLRRPVDPAWLAASRDVPLTREVIRRGAHLVDGVEPLPDRELSPAAWMWRQPAVTILSTTFPLPGSEKNAVRGKSSVRLSVRLAPGQTKDEMMAALEETLTKDVPGGIRVSVTCHDGSAMSWDYQTKGPAFDAADRAYARAWGKTPIRVGVGGSIPFVALFGRKFVGLPLILNGVMDPETTAHGPNESMHLGVFKKAIAANVHLLDELSRVPPKSMRT
ncbi:MAG: M20/M25/M40 family metallo-hydrolase [Polyangiaceae bacterium]